MRKRFTRFLAALALLVFMTPSLAGWGQTRAEVVAYTLEPASGSNNSYTGNCDITIDGITWNLAGNSQQIPWRIGGKSLNGEDRTLYSKTAISDNVTKIEVTHGTASSITVNSWTVIVATNASFSNVVSTLTPTFEASTTTTINRPDGADWTNCYYKFVYNVTVTGTSNKFFQFTRAKFYKESSGPTQLSAPTLTPTAGNGQVSLSWNAVTGADSYTVMWADNASFTGGTEVPSITSTTWTKTGLTNGQTYYFKAKSIGDGENYNSSDYGDAVNATPAIPQLAQPVLTVTPGNAQLIPTWEAVANASSYTLEYSTNSAFPQANTTTIAHANSGTAITGLTNNTPYYLRLKAVGDETNYATSAWSETVSATPSNLVTITINQSCISSFTNSYKWYSWTAGGISGQAYAYKNAGIQVNSSNQANCIYNTTPIPGIIKSIKMVKASGTTRSWTVTVGNTTLTSTDDGTTLTAQEVNTGTTWNIEGDHTNFLLSVSGGATTIESIEIKYEPAPTYAVTINSYEHGTINVKKNGTAISSGDEVYEGASMTLESNAVSGYALRQWNVIKDDETPVAVTNNAFTMPGCPITVGATFEALRTVSLADGITGGTVTRSTEACLSGTEVTITANANSGYRFGSFTVTAADAGNVEVSTTENVGTFTMPAKNVTVNATFIQRHTVTYKANGGTGDDDVNTYDHGTNVTVKNNNFTAPDGKYFSKWNTQADGNGDDFEEGATINSIAASYDMYAKWLNRTYNITFNVNGNTTAIAAMNITHDTPQALPTPTMAGFDFIGWATTPNGTTYVDKTSYNPSGNEENITLYAVFGSLKSGVFEITYSTSGVPSGYSSNLTTTTIGGKSFSQKQIMKATQSTDQFVQFASGAGVLYNNNSFGVITSIVITYYASSGGKNIVVRGGNEIIESSTGGSAIEKETDGDVHTFTFPSNCGYFYMYNGSNANRVNSIVINYEETAPNTVIYGVETKEANYEITTPTVIASGAVLDMNGHTLTNTTAANLVIEDGGQLIINTPTSKTGSGVNATVKKEITGFGGVNSVQTGWYTIASPLVSSITPADDMDYMLTATYDLYYYDEENMKWKNYKQNSFNLAHETGYLYANSSNKTLSFEGEVQYSDATITTALSYSAIDNNVKGFNLMGNPFTCNITGNVKIGDEDLTSYYIADGTVNGGKNLIPCELSERAIKPCEGFIVQTDAKQNLVFNPKTPDLGKRGESAAKLSYIRIEAGNADFMDRAYVQIGRGNTLRKMAINDNVSHVYVMNDGKDYAVATIEEAQGEMPVNFKAHVTGEYTITVNPQEVEMGYLHLIDNIAGVDVDLLANPSYTFNACYDDYESRFRLVFSANMANADLNDDFAFFSNGQLVIANEGEAILQVIDVNGRIIATESINGTCSKAINAKAGVYVLRLINGTDVKTQKMVIR